MGFLGYEEDYEEYKKTSKSVNVIGEKGNQISSDDIPPLSPEDALIIKQTRVHNDFKTVYMQSDSSFYDSYYNQEVSENDEDKELNDIMTEIKSIRRIYKDYRKYLIAVELRRQYIDMLVDKYGGEELFTLNLESGLVKEWLPPKPSLSSVCPDYNLYLSGQLPLIVGDWDDDKLIELMDKLSEDINPDEIGVVGSVITNPLVLSEKHGTTRSIFSPSSNSFDGVTTSDLQELQRIMGSWIGGESESNSSDKYKNENYFSKTKESIEKEYFGGAIIDISSLGDLEDDPNEMVIDSETNRPMTRQELEKRMYIRFLRDHGWDEWKLMKHFKVGSGFELKLMEQKQRIKRSAKKKAMSFMSDLTGEDMTTISSIDQLNDILFDD